MPVSEAIASSLKVVVFYGSTRPQPTGIRAAQFVLNKLKETKHEVYFADAKTIDAPLFEKFGKFYTEEEHPKIFELRKKVEEADAFIVVSGEYNHSIPPALLNMLDICLPEYRFKPVGFVTYSVGPFGGVRTLPQLRTLFGELGSVSIATTVPVADLANVLNEDGEDVSKAGTVNNYWPRFLKELEFYGDALKGARAKGIPYEPPF